MVSYAAIHFKKLLVSNINNYAHWGNVKMKICQAVAGSDSLLQTVSGGSIISRNLSSGATTCQKDSKMTSEDNIVWVDMEMTGLEFDKDHILEVACLVTDKDLNILDEGIDLVIKQPPEVLKMMNDWSTIQHAKSGLTRMCQESQMSLKEAELKLLQLVRKWTPKQKCPIAGNTIYIDRMFLREHMPDFDQHMHYRIIDVSSIKELCRRWYPESYESQPNKKDLSKHRALSDIKASIEELKFYRGHIFSGIQNDGVEKKLQTS